MDRLADLLPILTDTREDARSLTRAASLSTEEGRRALLLALEADLLLAVLACPWWGRLPIILAACTVRIWRGSVRGPLP